MALQLQWNILKKLSLLIILLLPLLGCAHYRPVPFSTEAVEERLTAPSNDVIRLKASRISHPILKPVPFNMSDGLSPDEAAILAVIVNPSLRALRNTRNLASAQLLQAGILPNPHISYSFESPTGGNISDKVNAHSIKFDWNVTALVAREAHINEALSHVHSIDIGIAWQEWQVAEAARLHVYHLIIARRRLALAEKAKYMAEHLYSILKKGVAIGAETDKELFSGYLLVEKARVNLLQARATLKSEDLALKKVLGIPGDSNIKLEKDISLPSVEHMPSISRLIQDMKKSRLDLIALRYGYESKEEHLRAAILSQLPEINIGLQGSKDTDGVKTIGTEITISLRLFDRKQGDIAIARATRQELFDEYMARVFDARSEIMRIVEEIHSTLKELKNADRAIEELQQLTKRYRQASELGGLSIVDYYRILLRLNTKKTDKLVLQRKLIDLMIGLEIASGFRCWQ